jgi:hypothetical protein
MFFHLMEHRINGDKVPNSALDRLHAEAKGEQYIDPELAMMLLLERLTAPQMAWQMVDTNTSKDVDTNPCIDIGNGVNTYCQQNPYE